MVFGDGRAASVAAASRSAIWSFIIIYSINYYLFCDELFLLSIYHLLSDVIRFRMSVRLLDQDVSSSKILLSETTTKALEKL